MKNLISKLRTHLANPSGENESLELKSILQNIQDVYYRIDADGKIVRVSDSVKDLMGYMPAEIIGQQMSDFYVDPDGRSQFLQALQAANGSITGYDVLLKRKDGNHIWASTNAHFLYDESRNVSGVEGIARNVTELKSRLIQLDKLSSVLKHTADMVMVTDVEGKIEYVNKGFENVTGYTAEEVYGKTPSILKSGKNHKEVYKQLWDTVKRGDSYQGIFTNKKKDGSLYYEEKTITPLKDENGKIIHLISTSQDISDRLEIHQRLHHMAHHDSLTGLPNRTLITDRLEQALNNAESHQRLVAIMFLDLDNFKTNNDSLGHNIGDELLIQLTQRLSRIIRSEDTVGRFGGDEFVILLKDIESEHHISALAHKILDTLATPFNIDNHDIQVTTSIGISIYPSDADNTESLLKYADIAMYKAKDTGKNNFQFYSQDMSARVLERLTLESHLRHALSNNQFILYYQPQFDLRTNKITGVEALVRWQHPELGLVPPANFIDLLEETGLIESVGKWILETACAQLKQWHDDGWGFLHMSINLSSRQFNNPVFVNSIQSIIESSKVNPEFIELEITESMLMRNASNTNLALQTLSNLGVRFAIDDFGTGYSSLNYLRRFPIDTIKIDRSFIHEITTDPDDAAITTAIIVMAKSLSLNVIAEGVESDKQLNFLRERECFYIQGYYFSQPLPTDDLSKLLHQKMQRLESNI